MTTPRGVTAPADPIVTLRHDVRSFLAEARASGAFVPRCDGWQAGFSPEFSRALGARGWVGRTWPVRYGGQDRPEPERHAIVTELLAAGAPVAAHWIAERQTGPLLLRYGTEAQRSRFLPAIARGEQYFALLMSEPNAGSDLASVRTRAERAEAGWRITGRKIWTSHAHVCQHAILLGRTAPAGERRHEGLSQFVIDLAAPGVTVRPIRLLSGEAHFNEVVLDDVFVPDELVLGEIGNGWAQVTSELAFERSGPERFLSLMPLLLETVEVVRASDDVTARETVGHLVSEVWALIRLSRSIVVASGGGEELARRAALVKDLGTRFEQEMVESIRWLLGREPAIDGAERIEVLLAEAIVAAPLFTIRGGTNEILRGIVARSLGLR